MQRPMDRFSEAAEAALGGPVDAVVPLMHRHRAWFAAGIAAYLALTIVLGLVGVHGVLRFALSGAAAGLAMTALTRQHLLVLAGHQLWLLAARPFRSRPDVLVGAVDRNDVTTIEGKLNDMLQIGDTRYVLPRLFRERAQEVLAEPSAADGDDAPPAVGG